MSAESDKICRSSIKWINPKERKPEGNVFWALTGGWQESDHRDWQIRRMRNNGNGDYRTSDYAGSYRLPGDSDWAGRDETIFAWLPLEAIPINDEDFE